MIPARFSRVVAVLLITACGTNGSAPTAPDDIPPVDTSVAPSPTYEYEFGAKFEPPIGRVVHGMGQWVVGNPQYLAMLPPSSQPASELMFLEIAETQRPWNPPEIAARIAAISAAGRIPSMDIALR